MSAVAWSVPVRVTGNIKDMKASFIRIQDAAIEQSLELLIPKAQSNQFIYIAISPSWTNCTMREFHFFCHDSIILLKGKTEDAIVYDRGKYLSQAETYESSIPCHCNTISWLLPFTILSGEYCQRSRGKIMALTKRETISQPSSYSSERNFRVIA